MRSNGRPSDCSAFRKTYHANDELYNNVVNFNNSYRPEEESELLTGMDRIVSEQAIIEQDIRRHLSLDRIRKQRIPRAESFNLAKAVPLTREKSVDSSFSNIEFKKDANGRFSVEHGDITYSNVFDASLISKPAFEKSEQLIVIEGEDNPTREEEPEILSASSQSIVI